MGDKLTARLQDQASAIRAEIKRLDARIDGVSTSGGSGSGVTDGDKGDIVISSSGTVYTLDSGVVSNFARTFLDDANAGAVRTTLGLGTAATAASGDFAAASHTQEISTVTGLQAALDGKEDSIASGTTSQYWRGDKSFQTLNKAAVGLGNVDNTTDAGKPVSTAQQTAIDAKLNASAVSAYGLTLVDDADAATARATLGLGTAAVADEADLLSRSNHTGTQTLATISDYYDPTDPVAPGVLIDDFYPGSGETGEIGAINWSFTNGTIFSNGPETNNPGIVGLRTGAANTVCSMYLGSNASAAVIRFDQVDCITWLFRATAANTDCAYQFGAMSAFGALTPTHGIYLERLSTDSNWFFVCCNASTKSRTDSGVAFDASWFKIKIRRHSASDVRFSLNGAAEVAVTSNVPDATDGLNIGNQRTGTTATTRDVLLDFFSMRALAQTR